MLIALALPQLVTAKSGSISGKIYTLDLESVQSVWPNARVTLKNIATKTEVSTVSNDLGLYSFSGVLYGEYEVTVSLAGFETAMQHITIGSDKQQKVDFQLKVAGQTQSVTVAANAATVDLSSSSGGAPTLTAKELKSVI